MMVHPARSPCSMVISIFNGLGGNPPINSNWLVPLIVAIWLYSSWIFVSRFISTTVCESLNNLTFIVVKGLLRLGYKMKFYDTTFFLVNLVAGLASDSEVPEPENAT